MITSKPTSEARRNRGSGNDLSKIPAGSFCFEKCKNRDKKCEECYRTNGEKSDYLPKEGARPREKPRDPGILHRDSETGEWININNKELLPKDKACRGDYSWTKENDKLYSDMRRYGKDKKASSELKTEYWNREESRKAKVRKEMTGL